MSMNVFGIGFGKRKAIAKVKDLLNQLSKDNGVSFYPDDEFSYLVSAIIRDKNGNIDSVDVGCRNLWKHTLFDEISVDDLFLSIVANAYHEEGHVIQYTKKFIDDFSDDALAMSLEDIAAYKNPYYYQHAIVSNISGIHAMYYYNLCELDAEKHAIMKLHEYVEREFPSVDADKAVLQYVEHKCGLDADYFLDKDALSQDDEEKDKNSLSKDKELYQKVLDAFDDRIRLSKSLSSMYVQHVKNQIPLDVAYENCQKDRNVSYVEFCDRFTDNHICKHIAQDRLVAAATLQSFPDLRKSHPNLDGLNLDLYYVIRHPLVKSGLLSEQIQEDKGHARVMDLDDKFGSILEAASRNHDGHGGLGE